MTKKLGTSQNGWPVYDDTENFTRVKVEGVGFWAANDDVALVLADFTQRYHDTIEKITLPVSEDPGYDDWSYAVRPVRGQTEGYSNHASASAWDLNSTRHPRGVKNTYSASQRAKLKKLVERDEYQVGGESVLRDGEFYGPGATIDGMHIEINASAKSVAKAADQIRKAREEAEDSMAGMTKKDVTDAVIDALKSEIIPNTSHADENGVKTNLGNMSVVRALELGDYKADGQNMNAAAEVSRDAAQDVDIDAVKADVHATREDVKALRQDIANLAATVGKLVSPPVGDSRA
jgi:hypothetical protein